MASAGRETTRGILVGVVRKLSGRVLSRRLGLLLAVNECLPQEGGFHGYCRFIYQL
jgi:hypothetical protein